MHIEHPACNAKNQKKSTPQPFEQSSLLRAPNHEALERTGLAVEGVGAPPGRLLGGSWALLGRSGALLGASWAPLGCVWDVSFALKNATWPPNAAQDGLGLDFGLVWGAPSLDFGGFGGVQGWVLGLSNTLLHCPFLCLVALSFPGF